MLTLVLGGKQLEAAKRATVSQRIALSRFPARPILHPLAVLGFLSRISRLKSV